MEEYVRLMMSACESSPLTIYQNPDAEYITDELIEKAELLFASARSLAENETFAQRVEKEYLSPRFLRITRSPLDTEGRNESIDEFFNDVKKNGLTEIRERRSLANSKKTMQEYQYVRERSGHKLYYIMQ
jgi:hypothetical protein